MRHFLTADSPSRRGPCPAPTRGSIDNHAQKTNPANPVQVEAQNQDQNQDPAENQD